MHIIKTIVFVVTAAVSFTTTGQIAAQPATQPAAKAVTASDLPARLPSPTDTAVFRRFTMDNGLRVLLVSDPKFNKSGAALVAHTGQIDDPRDSEGMAHFLEHMLFLGTEKYPDVSEYSSYIRSNGGSNNAYTTSDHTNYHFEIRHDALRGALDRFAQFFIAPKFNAEFTAREVNAVHNEAMRHVQNDFRRAIGVARELYDPNSGESKFSTGNKDTLARATPERVRAFYESQYTADRMALSIAGKASLDELEKMAREMFAAIPRRNVNRIKHEPTFLPRKTALRMAYAEPIKEVRQLSLEFVVPATRPDFAGKSDVLIADLLSHPGSGGLVDQLKRDGLLISLEAGVWERTSNYGSLQVTAALTVQGQAQHQKVLTQIFAYLEQLRAAPFPTAFFNDRARVALLKESYGNRGEGSGLATNLANSALFYPLDVAERAAAVWGKPNEAAYRRFLDVLRPDNMLAILMAQGLPTDKTERIYATKYSYREDSGAVYTALLNPAKTTFAMPGANRFMPTTSTLLAERPIKLIDDKSVQLFYAADTEFKRPQTTLVFRFVPARAIASADSAALLQLYGTSLGDALTPALAEADFAGVQFSPSMSLEGLRFTISGYGDSPARFANHVASQLQTFTITPQRFEALKELSLRGIRSYAQTEARQLATNRRDALSREFWYLPDELLARTTTARWVDVHAFAKRFFAKGRLEAIVHGHISADDAAAVTRAMAKQIGATPLAETELLRRRHTDIARNENVIDAGQIEGVNSAYVGDYLLDDNSPATRAAAVVLGNFIGEPFYTELRTKQQLGYIVAAGFGASQNQRYVSLIVQSSVYGPDELRRRAEAFIKTLPAALAAVTDAQWTTLVAGARSNIEQAPKSIAEKANYFFTLAFEFDRDWERRQATLAALDSLTKGEAVALLTRLFAEDGARRRTVLLHSKAHEPKEKIAASFADRNLWKTKRKFQ